MSGKFRKNFKVAAVIHVLVVSLLLLMPLIQRCRKPEKSSEIITYIDFQQAPPAPPSIESVLDIAPPPPPEPPAIIPEPPKKKKKKKIEISKKKVKLPTDAPPPKQKLTEAELKKLLSEGAPTSSRKSSVVSDIPAWYYALVRQTMHDRWEQPGGLSAMSGLRTTVEIRVEKNGAIRRRKILRPSGSNVMDESVMRAVNSVSSLKALPAQYPKSYKDITVDFELTR